MSNLNFSYGIRSNLPAHPESPASIGAKFVNTLEALSRIDLMVFPNWEVMDFPARDSLPLAAARPRIAAIIDNNVSRDDFGQPEPYGGYSAGAYTSHSFSPHGMNLRIRAGVRYVPRSSGGDVSSLQGRAARDQRDLASRLGLRLCLQDGLRQGATVPRRRVVSLFALPHPVACLTFSTACRRHRTPAGNKVRAIAGQWAPDDRRGCAA